MLLDLVKLLVVDFEIKEVVEFLLVLGGLRGFWSFTHLLYSIKLIG